jgi:hypothetical protein
VYAELTRKYERNKTAEEREETKKKLSENMEYKTKGINSYVFTVLITQCFVFYIFLFLNLEENYLGNKN